MHFVCRYELVGETVVVALWIGPSYFALYPQDRISVRRGIFNHGIQKDAIAVNIKSSSSSTGTPIRIIILIILIIITRTIIMSKLCVSEKRHPVASLFE